MKRHVLYSLQDDYILGTKVGKPYFVYIREASLIEKLINRWSIIVYVDDKSGKQLFELDLLPYVSWEHFEQDWSFSKPL